MAYDPMMAMAYSLYGLWPMEMEGEQEDQRLSVLFPFLPSLFEVFDLVNLLISGYGYYMNSEKVYNHIDDELFGLLS